MSLSLLTALPRRIASTAVGAATHPVSTVARGVGLARGTATGLARAVQVARGGEARVADGAGAGAGAPTETPAAPGPTVVTDRVPPSPDPEPTPDPERTAPGSVVKPEPPRGWQRTPEPEPELVYSTSTPEGAEPGADHHDAAGDLLDPGTAHALAAEAEMLARAADPDKGD